MTRVLIALILSASPALTAADIAKTMRSQDAPWVKPREVKK